jgi:Protein kinase domain
MASQATAFAAEPFMAATAAVSPPTIHGYHILRLLGEGGMGQVWLADDLTLGRRVAIKTITEAHAGQGRARSRFLREARVMATVEHPHVVRVYAYGDASGLAYFVMEFVDGETLAARLRRSSGLAPTEALRVTRQVALALASASQRGVIHRDVKPSNVLLDTESRVRVADFGLARAATASEDQWITDAGAVVGSPHYMSPEQARGQSVDFRTDVYSLGVVLFEMLAGRRPFAGSSPMEVIAHHLHDGVPPLHDRRPDLPSAVVALVDYMTAKEPERRPPSYRALLQCIDESASDAIHSETASETTAIRWPGRRPEPSRRSILAGLIAMTAAASGGILWWARAPSVAPAAAGSLAIVAFYGPDEGSLREGRMLAALVEAELGQRLGESLRVVGADDAGPPIRSESAARALGGRLGVDSVVWGQALSFGPRVEAQPWLTSARGSTALAPISIESDERRGALERRRNAAQALADAVLLAAGRDALETRPEAALLLAQHAGTSPDAADLIVKAPRPQ